MAWIINIFPVRGWFKDLQGRTLTHEMYITAPSGTLMVSDMYFTSEANAKGYAENAKATFEKLGYEAKVILHNP